MSNRIRRISEDIKREIGGIMQNELKDPRLPGMVSVVSVDVSKDCRYARVYVSVMGGEEDKNSAIEALSSAAGFIRREIGRRIRMRNIPELHFKIDDSIEHSIYISKLIRSTVVEGDNREDSNQEDREDNK